MIHYDVVDPGALIALRKRQLKFGTKCCLMAKRRSFDLSRVRTYLSNAYVVKKRSDCDREACRRLHGYSQVRPLSLFRGVLVTTVAKTKSTFLAIIKPN
jgi:hypothetical protein